jgi:DNA gyrase subunit B
VYVYNEEHTPDMYGFSPDDNIEIQRYKGLGEMNAEQLWETTMDPETRILKQITIVDAEEADRLFRILMGEDVQSRRHFILTNAKTVKDLDI